MNLASLISDLAARDIRLWVENGALKFSAPAGAFDAATRELVVGNKPALIAFLSQDSAHDSLAAAPALAHPPLSAGEERLWFLYRYEGPSPVYNVLTTVHTPVAVDMAAHSAAVSALVARHESLRTRFDEAEGVPFRVVEAAARIVTPLIDLSALPAPVRDAQIAALIAQEEQFLFALTAAPLLRSSVLRLAPARHLVMINIHHAATDAWSMGVLMREYSALAEAFEQGRDAALPALTHRYADFAHWQQQQLASGGFAGQLAFWREYLGGLAPLLELPADYPRPAVKRYEGRSERRLLPGVVAEKLGEICRGCGATLFMGLLAAFKLLLARHAQVSDVAVGTAVAGRRHAEMANIAGMFTNTIVVRSQVDETLSFAQLIAQVRDATLQAQANQDIPFRAVVEALVAERSLAHTPLYQVSLALNNAAEREILELAGHAEQFSDNDGIVSTAVKDDLSVQFRRFADALELKLTYDVHLYSATTAARLTDQFAGLLARLVEAPAAPLRAIALLGGAEREQLRRLGINEGADWPQHAGLCELFAAQVLATPQAIAVQDGDAQYSYALLARMADGLAAQLRAAGAKPLDRIGLCVTRAADMTAGMLAILKTGAAYVPLDLGYPRAALDHIIADTGLRIVLSAADAQPWSEQLAITTLALDLRAAAVLPGAPDAAYFGSLHPAYVIYTSGSTGKPKGVEVAQRNIVRLVRGADYIPITAQDVFVQMSNHAFDAATLEVWGALLNGGRLVHVDRQVVLDPQDFSDFLAEHAVSAMFITVALFNLMADVNPRGLASVRHVTVGGDALNPAAVRRVFEQGKPARLINAYGPTENTTFSTWHEFSALEDCARCSIGGPIAHSSAHVVDVRGELVPAGVVGELLVGGPGVALGYVNRPELTAERFVPDPFSDEPGARLYRSGDWVKRDEQGRIDYIGRFDNQVKIRGFRIETDEIQEQLTAHPAVREAVVVVQTDARGDKRLAAYLVTSNGEADLAAIRDFLRQQLPDYKQPAAYACLERLPLTPNGKIDRARLPLLAAQASTAAAAAVAPRDALEQRIAAHWRELLGVGDVAVSDNFFELGGHSLLAITLSVRLRDELGVDLCTRDIFEHPSLAGLAARIRSGQLAAAPQLPPLHKATRREKSTLSFVQQRLWFIAQMEGAQATYHMPLLLEFAPQYSADAIAAALNAVVARHESLRTALVEVNGIPLQRIRTDCVVDLPLSDLSALHGSELEEQRDELIGATLSEAFDLGEAPLLRARLIRLPGASHLLVISVHHVVCDGWSLGNLTRELALLLSGDSGSLPELSVQYGDYAHWQKTWLDGDILARQLDFWRERLAGAPPLLSLRCARPRPAQRSDAGRTATARLDAPLAARLKELAQREGASLFMAMLAGFKLLLARHAGHDDIVVGTPIANRPRSELEPLIGFFANTLVLRTRLDQRASFGELIALVRDNCLAAYAYQDTPLDLLVDALNPQRSLAYAPLVQIVFGQENFGALDAGLPAGMRPVSLRGENRTAKFDLNLSFEEDTQGLQLYCEYSSELFDAEQMCTLLQHYESLLRRLAAAPAQPLARISLLGEAAEAQAMQALNARAAQPRETQGVAALFERIAQSQGGEIALLGDDGDWLYADLAAAAQRVAAALRAAGVQPQQPVAVAMQASPWRVAAELGVLYCGAIVLPLAVEQGSAALAATAARAGAAVLLGDADLAPVAGLAQIIAAASLPQAAPQQLLDLGTDALAYIVHADEQAAGVALTHASIVHLARDSAWLPQAGQLRGAAAAAFNSDEHLLETWTPLLNGASLVVTSTHCAEVNEFAALLARCQVQWLYLAAAQLEAWLPQLPAELPQLQVVVTGGDNLGAASRALLARRLPQAALRRVHGPAENGVVSLTLELDAATGADAIGASVAGSRCQVLDEDGERAPCGVAGLLHYGGNGLAQGYWRDAAQTALCFVPDAQSGKHGARLFRAAERAALDAAGQLAWHGADRAKLRAGRFALEPEALQALLKKHADIHDAAVLVHTAAGAPASLVAFVVPRDSGQELAGLQQQLQRTLPPSQQPQALIVLDALPQTAAGAVDRQLLQRRLRGSGQPADTTAPASATEQAIAAIWAELLGQPAVGRHANFFELGGHSLLAAQVCARINQHFGISLRVKSFYASADLAALALLVDEAAALDAALADVDLDNLSDEEAEKLLAQLQSET